MPLRLKFILILQKIMASPKVSKKWGGSIDAGLYVYPPDEIEKLEKEGEKKKGTNMESCYPYEGHPNPCELVYLNVHSWRDIGNRYLNGDKTVNLPFYSVPEGG